jgi:bifunctional DNA-binding transcriptional regulator/antitoxin component of YhaV-PrlF toxin-antitoxin module
MEPKFIDKAKLTKQGQLTLPQEARKSLKIEAESEVYWYELNNVLVVVKDLVNPKELVKLIFEKKKR